MEAHVAERMLLITLIVGFFSPFTAFSLSEGNLPKITSFQYNFVDVVGPRKSRRLELECQVTGNPEPDIEFQLNGRSIMNESRTTKISKNKITIDNVTYQNDDGKYRCVAVNEHGRIFKEEDIKIKTIGKFNTGYDENDPVINLKVKLGLPKEIFCPSHSYAYPLKYLWSIGTKPPKILQEDRNKVFVSGGSGLFYSILSEYDVEEVNRVGLHCILKMGEDFVASVAHKFLVDGSVSTDLQPQIHTKLPLKTFGYQNEEVTLTCTAVGNPQPDIIWFRNGVLVNWNDSRYGINPYQPGKLTIKRIDNQVDGQYKCLAKNRVGQAESIGDVIIAIPVTFNKSLTPKTVSKGDNVSLECSAFGTEPITYEWYRNGSLLSSYDVGNFSMKINGGILEINSVQYTDAGAYQCFVSNKYGKQYSAATLTITAPKLTDETGPQTNFNNNAFPLKYIIIIACATFTFIIVILGAVIAYWCKRKRSNRHRSVIYIPAKSQDKKSSVDHLPLPPKSFTDLSEDEFSSDSEKPIDFIETKAKSRPNFTRRTEITSPPDKPEHLYYAIPDTRTAGSSLNNRLHGNHWRNSNTPSAIL